MNRNHRPAAEPASSRAWHTHTPESLAEELSTDLHQGLAQDEAARRLTQYGYNRLAEIKTPPAWQILLAQFNNLLIIILIIAAAISGFLLNEWLDAAAIGVILLLNALLGFIQEYRAEHALAALKKLAAPKARVVRNGTETVIPAEEVVPGDIVVLTAGDRVAADLRLTEAHMLCVDESSLTGESLPAEKNCRLLESVSLALGDRSNMLYSGTTTTRGRARGIAVATGQQTEMGRIVELVAAEKEKTPLQQELHSLGVRIAYICLGVCLIVLVCGLLRGHPWEIMFLTAISLAVAAIPEGLPAAVTVSLALGVKRMVRKNALVRRLHAVETLGSTTFICSDKTGTITVNRMRVERIVVAVDGRPQLLTISEAPRHAKQLQLLLKAYVLCNDVQKDPAGRYQGDPLEIALLVAAQELGIVPDRLQHDLPRIAEIPFEAERKAMSTIHRLDGQYIVFTKGAPEELFRLSTPAPSPEWTAVNQQLTACGYRTLAFALRQLTELPDPIEPATIETQLTFLGLAALSDPPRTEVKDAIATCHRAGIKVAMVTGDHRLTAETIAREVGLLPATGAPAENGPMLLTGPELEALPDEAFVRIAEGVRVYARVSPLQKVKIVRALKQRGHIVAMTGDGVNDAPALKLANIGVAMGITGTDVSKEAADMVLLDDNFATIVTAVDEGRTIFANLRKFVYFLLSCNLKEVLTVLFASLAGYPIVYPIQILWVNLITDGAPALALGVDPPDPQQMSRPPRNTRESILSLRNLSWLMVQGTILTLGSILAYILLRDVLHHNEAEIRTATFSILALAQLFHAFNFRVGNGRYFSTAALANRRLIWAVLASLFLQGLITFVPVLNTIFGTVPLTPEGLLIVVICSLAPVLIINLINQRRAVAA